MLFRSRSCSGRRASSEGWLPRCQPGPLAVVRGCSATGSCCWSVPPNCKARSQMRVYFQNHGLQAMSHTPVQQTGCYDDWGFSKVAAWTAPVLAACVAGSAAGSAWPGQHLDGWPEQHWDGCTYYPCCSVTVSPHQPAPHCGYHPECSSPGMAAAHPPWLPSARQANNTVLSHARPRIP